MTKIKKRSKSRSRILSVCLLICIIAVGFSLGGCFKILEMIAESLQSVFRSADALKYSK